VARPSAAARTGRYSRAARTLARYVSTQPGWTLTATYSDDASGATTSRPGLQAALRAARDGWYDTLLVYRVDRFSRCLSDLLDLLTELDQAGVAFASATEPFDTSTSIGRMLVQLLGVFAEFERETIFDRVTAGMNAKAAKGKWPGGRTGPRPATRVAPRYRADERGSPRSRPAPPRPLARTGGRPWRCSRRSPAASPLDGAPVQADPEPGGYLDGQFGA
jgi:DNA invertase Pin-like site-specific DNA recombinase